MLAPAQAAPSGAQDACAGWRATAVFAALVASVALLRPYTGIVGDSAVYMGGALAALDPQGVGQDPMWRLDGQMRFSLFPMLLRPLVAALGAQSAALLVAACGLLLWSIALVVLARVLAGRANAVAVALACASFSAAYSSYATVYYGEPIATPRVFAEAAVLAALAATLAARSALAALFACLAIMLHPVMAAAGVGVIFVFHALSDRRWLVVGFAAAVLLVGAAALGAPFLDRLTTPIDPQWLAMLRGPDDYLFPTTWPERAWALLAQRGATVALAAVVTQGATRRLFISILVIGSAAMTLALVFGDLYPLLLVAQAQPWRAGWLLALAAAAGFGLCGVTLWREGPVARIILALLALSWLIESSAAGALVAGLALALRIAHVDLSRYADRGAGRWLWIGVGLLSLFEIVVYYRLAAASTAAAPVGARPPPYWLLLDGHAFAVPIALLGVCLAMRPPLRIAPRLLAALSAAFCLVVAASWRQEWDAYRMTMARSGRQSELIELLSARPGPILWLGGNQEAWYWAGRPNWAAGVQGNAIIYSRELTFIWFERMRALIDEGWLADGGTISRKLSKPDPLYPDMSPQKLAHFCARGDAPAWILAPIPTESAAAGATVWRAPVRRFAFDPSRGELIGVDLFAVHPCADVTRH
ncbi:hypothetical protein CQW49_17345 [Methylosinus trichosporium OB3b]|uniref:Glycosyltransferase RgtA/B/C/D-like domain-containing protein n=1 Tax=Methylosinus trichosporium (strain ATCC 35070 / NCIMB 11131 / UNIQEM 75 / OB3b) TaxID=595536 RepID=A0A2D2D366_METT3|nr:hypothetical protein CQW49_17345 [Methylosinus trichosporium OB3b]OBS52962.1 hypothetical protein A8B73_08755 [Methylosinus sp. 3S-1]